MSLPLQSGIYLIRNTITNQCYIGSACGVYGIRGRIQEHIRKLNKQTHTNPKLQNSWNKYGESNFTFEVVELCSKQNCINKEQYHIDLLKPNFNIRKLASSNLGLKHSQKVKDKLSKHFKNLFNKKTILIDLINQKTLEFESVNAVCNFLNITQSAVSHAIRRNNIVKKQYRIKFLSKGEF